MQGLTDMALVIFLQSMNKGFSVESAYFDKCSGRRRPTDKPRYRRGDAVSNLRDLSIVKSKKLPRSEHGDRFSLRRLRSILRRKEEGKKRIKEKGYVQPLLKYF